MPGVVKLVGAVAWLPTTERGNTKPLTADPGTLVPGVASSRTVAAVPVIAVGSVNNAAPPPAGVTL
jgi:hypothetical protein